MGYLSADDIYNIVCNALFLQGASTYPLTPRPLSHTVLVNTVHSPKKFSNTLTLQPVEQRGTSIFWYGHNIANTACIHFKFGTVNNWYMPNSKPKKLGKTCSPNLLCNPLYNVDILIKNRFWSSNYTPYSIHNALGTRTIGIWMFVSINNY